jgi:GntR family carbon starvation induced transcriptional regulator
MPPTMKLVETSTCSTLSSTVYERVRHGILRAQLAPETKLRIEDLAERYGVGTSPVREALHRLAAEGLVSKIDQRGFRVSPISVDEVVELAKTRRWINTIALRESIAKGEVEWEERMVLSLHRLAKISLPAAGVSAMDDTQWNTLHVLHKEFHHSLIAACGSRFILEFSDKLFDFSERYQHIGTMSSAPCREVDAEHRAIMDACVARDAETAIKLMNQHVDLSCEIVLSFLRSAGQTSSKLA